MDQNTPLKRLSQHQVENLVVFCMDFRFKSDLHEAIKKAFDIDEFDELKLAGSAGNLALLGTPERKKTLMDDIALAVNAHKVGNIYLLNHQGCGAYGMAGKKFAGDEFEAEKDFHAQELEIAKNHIKEMFPHVQVHPALVAVDPDTDELSVIM